MVPFESIKSKRRQFLHTSPQPRQCTHFCFGDESHHNVGRYRAIAAVSVPRRNFGRVNDDISAILELSGIKKEFSWEKVRTADYRRAAQRILDCSVELARQRILFIDVLVWDTHDDRHKIIGRDDDANIGRMWYHLLKHVIEKRGRSSSVWQLFPHQGSAANWGVIRQKINSALGHAPDERKCVIRSVIAVHNSPIRSISPQKAESIPLIQVADLYAGLATYSRTHFQIYQDWIQLHYSRTSTYSHSPVVTTNSERQRFMIMEQFWKLVRRRNLGITFEVTNGLETSPYPLRPVNIWFYRPQHHFDRAPVR